MIKKINKINILVIVIIILMLITVLATSTYAIWQMTPDAGIFFEMKVGDENPSKKYQLFVPIDEYGQRISGTLSIRRYFKPYVDGDLNDYTLNEDYYEEVVTEISDPTIIEDANNIQYYYKLEDQSQVSDIKGLALVGSNGGIAITKIEVAESVEASEYAISGFTYPDDEFNVTKIIVDAEFRDYYFRNNSIIKELIVPGSVTRIDAGAFASMGNLEKVIIYGTATDSIISIGQGAFGNCYKLPSINTPEGRIMEEEEL